MAKTDAEIEWQHNKWPTMIANWHSENRDAWMKKLKDRQKTYVLIDPYGKRHQTTRLSDFCAKHNLHMPRLMELASWHEGNPLHRKTTWRGWDCYRKNSLRNNRRRKEA